MVLADALMYAELHCHSAYSFLDGASPPDEILAEAHRLGYPAIALTDHDDLGGAVRWAEAGKEHGVEAVIGPTVSDAIVTEPAARSIKGGFDPPSITTFVPAPGKAPDDQLAGLAQLLEEPPVQ